METRTQVTEEDLRRSFEDTLDRRVSYAGILVSYHEDGRERMELGVPYSIENGSLIVGSYPKDLSLPPPEDYDDRNKAIPISDIDGYLRIGLVSLVRKMSFFMRDRDSHSV